MNIVPADDTIADLEKKAAEYEEHAAQQCENVTLLREKAKLCRDWIIALRSGKWMSLKK